MKQLLLAVLLAHVSFAACQAHAAGLYDADFHPPSLVGGRLATELPSGKILVSGGGPFQVSPFGGQRAAIRLLSDGTTDTGFDTPDKPAEVTGHAVATDGTVYLYGRFNGYGGHPTRWVARLNDNGSTDTSFTLTASLTLSATTVLPLPDGRLMVAAYVGDLLRIRHDGTADDSFKPVPALAQAPFAVALLPTGKLLVIQLGKIFRLNADGSRDTTYSEVTFEGASTDSSRMVVTPEGGCFVGAPTRPFNGGALRTLVKLLPDGGADPQFTFALDGTTAGTRDAQQVALQPDGKILFGGVGFSPSALARLLPDGSVDATFEKLTQATAVSVDHLGRVLALGNYIQMAPTFVVKSGIVRLANDSLPRTPAIATQPAGVVARVGELATFTVIALGAEPLSYQWQRNGQDLAGATNASYAIAAVSRADAGDFRVVVTNPFGSQASATAGLTVLSAPVIVAAPTGFTLRSGVATNLSATVKGEEPLSLQWYRNGVALEGTTGPVLNFASLASRDSGSYVLVATNAYGTATSPATSVHVLATLPQWVVTTNATSPPFFTNTANPFRPDAAIRVASDGLRGSVLLYTRGVERWDDAGERLWSVRFAEGDAGALNTLAVDPDGNAYVSGAVHYTAMLGDLGITNNSAITGPNGHVQAFIAKLDQDGHGLWFRLFEAAGPRIYGLAVDHDGGVVFAGAHGGKNGRSLLGHLFIPEEEYAASVAGKIGPDGTPQWLQRYAQFTFNRATCEADSVTIDDTGIYLSGVMSASIQFGTNQLQNLGLPVNWIGKLGTNAVPQWVRSTGSAGWQGAPLIARGGRRWMFQPRERVLQSWSEQGALLASFNVVAGSASDNIVMRDLGVTADGEPIVIGTSAGFINVGGTTLTQGATRPLLWFGQWDASGTLRRARILATPTNTASSFVTAFSAPPFAVSPVGDVILAGAYAGGLRFLSQDQPGLGGAYLAKVSRPALTPEITQALIAAYTLDTGGEVQIGIQAAGPAPITYQWRRDGVLLPNQTNSFLKITDARITDAGRYDVVVTNPYGSTTSGTAVITVNPPFQIRSHPVDRLVLQGGELSGDAIGVAALTGASLTDKLLSFVITNTTSPKFPLGGQFTTQFKPGSYEMPATGVFGLHQGSWLNLSPVPDFADLLLRPWTFDQGRPNARLTLGLWGRFTFHIDAATADACCASGTYTIQGGGDSATFQVVLSSSVPDGSFQWQRDGVDLPGQTTSTLQFAHVTAADAGHYRCVITYRGYTETSRAAELRIGTGAVVPEPPILTFTPPAPGATSLDFTWPAGYVLQRATSLAPPNWADFATTPPVKIPMAQPGEFFRLMRVP